MVRTLRYPRLGGLLCWFCRGRVELRLLCMRSFGTSRVEYRLCGPGSVLGALIGSHNEDGRSADLAWGNVLGMGGGRQGSTAVTWQPPRLGASWGDESSGRSVQGSDRVDATESWQRGNRHLGCRPGKADGHLGRRSLVELAGDESWMVKHGRPDE